MCACRNVNLGLLHKAFGMHARYLAARSGIPIPIPYLLQLGLSGQ